MDIKALISKSGNLLEGNINKMNPMFVCKKCKSSVSMNKVRSNYFICPRCGYYYPIRARRRILMLVDARSFYEKDRDYFPKNILMFPGYDEKLLNSVKRSHENESVVCGLGTIFGIKVAIFSMESRFMMGSMGSVTGEKITRLFEYAIDNSLPVIGVVVSGGARMQEGMLSLMQMSKVSAAVKKHSDMGNLYISLLTNPTTGGVEASFAMQADIILAEPNARVGFAGPRVIEKTLKEKLPQNFQMSESVLECGFIDEIVARDSQRKILGHILKLHDNH